MCKFGSGVTDVDGWINVHFDPWTQTLSKDCSLASNPSTKPLSATLQIESFQHKIKATVANTQLE